MLAEYMAADTQGLMLVATQCGDVDSRTSRRAPTRTRLSDTTTSFARSNDLTSNDFRYGREIGSAM